MKGSEEVGVEVVFVDADRNALVAKAEVRAKGVSGFVFAAAVPIEAIGGDDLLAKRKLISFGIIFEEDRIIDLLFFGYGLDQVNLLGTNSVKDCPYIRRFRAGLVAFQ